MKSFPIAVLNAAKQRASLGKGELAVIGTYKGMKVYSYKFSEPVVVGLPELYLWNNYSVRVVSGEDAEDVLVAMASSVV